MTPVAPLGTLHLGWSTVYVRTTPDGLALIDAGPDYDGAWESVQDQLAALGRRPEEVRDVLITHAHVDHAGLATRWQMLGARIWAGAADSASLAAGVAGSDRVRLAARALLLRQGVPAALFSGRIETSEDAPVEGLRRGHYDHGAHWPGALRFAPASTDAQLEHGATVAGLEVIACPGHTPGSISLHDTAGGLLYTGDHLLPGITPPPGFNFFGEQRLASLPAWLDSLRRLSEFAHARVLPGHGAPFDHPAAAVARTLAHIEQRARRVQRHLRDRPRTAYELLHQLFPHLPAGLLWFKLAEVIGLLDLLMEREAVRHLPGDLDRYALA